MVLCSKDALTYTLGKTEKMPSYISETIITINFTWSNQEIDDEDYERSSDATLRPSFLAAASENDLISSVAVLSF